MASAAGDDDDIIWEEEDPDFALALSLYMDSLGTNESSNKPPDTRRPAQTSASAFDNDSDDEMWSEDDPDFALALSMYLDEMEEHSTNTNPLIPPDTADCISMTGCVIDRQLEELDPNPDIWKLFRIFDDRFFDGQLKKKGVMLSWSPRMTSCAGICSWRSRSHFCEIRLSQPLLMLRPRSDLVETLIHEMIHAILFVTHQDDNHESHGQFFHHHMFRINKAAGCNISVYHNFHDEVRHYQKHVWKCDGPCNKRPPYYGIVRRAMNRAPGPKDYWFPRHQATCGGTFVKIESPEKPVATSSQKSQSSKNRSKSPVKKPPKGTPDIRNFFPGTPDKPHNKPGQSGSVGQSSSTITSSTAGVSNVKSISTLQSESGSAVAPETNGVSPKDSDRPGSSRSASGPFNFKPFSGAGHVLGSGPTSAPPTATQRMPLHPVPSNKRTPFRSTTIEVVADPVPIELIELD